jgi:thiol-disulfide isomerase/thioredoxin
MVEMMKNKQKKNYLYLGLIVLVIILAIFLIEKRGSNVSDDFMNDDGEYVGVDIKGISGYINADESFNLREIVGEKVILVDFWTYSCVNCLRTTPFLNSWHEKYADKGLVIVGVHTPEFDFEKDYKNVQDAVKMLEIKYPVVLDNDYKTWRYFQNRYWPHKYLIDKSGRVVYDHIGEGGYEETEKQIQKALSELGSNVEGVELVEDVIRERREITSELYAGYDFALPRGQIIDGLKPNEVSSYAINGPLVPNQIYLVGDWRSNKDSLEAVSGSELYLVFKAKEVNLVLEGGEVEVTVDSVNLDLSNVGDDVVFENGVSLVKADMARLYNVYDGPYVNNLLHLKFSDGAKLNAFTFG